MIEEDRSEDPLAVFAEWIDLARREGLPEPTAMTLATATPSGRPSARIVLLKGVDDRGFVFVTCATSRKGREIAANPWGSLVFSWIPLSRQVRVEGPIHPAAATESDRLFAARPRDAQLGAWASSQSEEIADREELERAVREAAARFPEAVPRPARWGAYRLVPETIEFWRGRPHRLHDRLIYERDSRGGFSRRRLAP